MATPESTLQSQVKKYVESRGGIVYKNQATLYSSAGFPDMTVIYRGVFIGLEHKVKGNYPSAIQKAWNHKLVDAGAFSIVDYSVDDVKEVMDKVDDFFNSISIGMWDPGYTTVPTVIEVINEDGYGRYEGKTK